MTSLLLDKNLSYIINDTPMHKYLSKVTTVLL